MGGGLFRKTEHLIRNLETALRGAGTTIETDLIARL
jgi:hypothetical protein